jgi:hypothetical protein
MKNRLQALRAIANRKAAKVAAVVGTGVAMVSQSAFAAIDLEAGKAAITASTTSAEGFGSLVIAAVAALAVVGVIIGLVRKI